MNKPLDPKAMSLDTILKKLDSWYNDGYDNGGINPREAKQALLKWADEQRVEELERVMQIPGNVFVGNGEHEIHWQTRNRINELKKTLTGGEK